MQNISEKMAQYQDQILKESQNIQELMAGSPTGKALMEASEAMAMSEEMQNLMNMIEDPDASDEDKFLMGKYMGQMLQEDPEKGLVNYSEYLNQVANDPNYKDRKEYYKSISRAALELNSADEFKSYVAKYNAFEKDMSEDTKKTRQAMNEMSEKMRNWLEEDGE